MSSVSSLEISSELSRRFNFTVDKLSLTASGGRGTPWFGLFRSDTNSAVGSGSVSSRYVPHTAEDVCVLTESAAAAFDGEVELDAHFRDGHYVNIMPTKSARFKVFGENDNIWPRIIIKAGYDGKAFSATIGYYRDACQNLAMMRKVSGTTVSIRHTSGLRKHMNSLIDTFSTLKQSWGNLENVVAHLQSREVRMADFLNQVYPQPTAEQLKLAQTEKVRAVTVHKNRTKAIFDRLLRERLITGRPSIVEDRVSAWEAYNAVQGYVQHEAQCKAGFAGAFDRILRASQDASVRRAESLLLEMSA